MKEIIEKIKELATNPAEANQFDTWFTSLTMIEQLADAALNKLKIQERTERTEMDNLIGIWQALENVIKYHNYKNTPPSKSVMRREAAQREENNYDDN